MNINQDNNSSGMNIRLTNLFREVIMCRIIPFIFVFICFASMAFGDIIHVPADQPTIQDGINAATTGDVVLVAEGTYFENINFMGKAITVASRFYMDHKKKHIRKTIINGSQPANPDFGSVVSFVSGEDVNSVLCGFTITGGTGTYMARPGFPPTRQGGGIFCNASGAKIVHNRIINNIVENAAWAMGGGFFNGPPFVPTTAILEENVIEKNKAIGQIWGTGGGMTFNSAGRVVNNIISHNLAYSFGPMCSGGGISASSWGSPPNPIIYEVLISGNKVLHNKAAQDVNAPPGISSHAGGMTIVGSKGVVSNNIFMFNEISPVDSGFGAGVVLDFPPQDLLFKNNIVAKNYSTGAGACYGGGVAIWDGSPTLQNNLIVKNKGTHGGGVWTGFHFCNAKISNNTISKNKASVQGGAINTYNASPEIMNSILWHNKAPDGAEIYVESGSINITYSDVKGGWTGTGNISRNPRLFTRMYFLGFRSPCIDAGNPDPMYNDPESIFRPGHAQLPARGTIRNDMGAYGGPAAADWWNFFNFAKELELVEFEEEDILTEKQNDDQSVQISQYPNPFNPSTTIQFALPNSGFVTLKIYNILGKEVATLASEKLAAGNYKYDWDASGLASGVYFYRLQTESGFIQRRKMLLVR